MAKMQALICRECGKEYSTEAVHVCELCFGPLEVKYNYDEIREKMSRTSVETGPKSLCGTKNYFRLKAIRRSASTRG